MKYDIVFEFNFKEERIIEEIYEYVDYTLETIKETYDDAFFRWRDELLTNKINNLKNYFKDYKYEIKVLKVLPKYLKEDTEIIYFNSIIQIKIQKEMSVSFAKKHKYNEFTKIKDLPGFNNILKNSSLKNIYIKISE